MSTSFPSIRVLHVVSGKIDFSSTSTLSSSLEVEAPEQTGQPAPRMLRAWTLVRHECPRGQRHHTLRPVLKVTSSGVSVVLRVGCHWDARSGRIVAKLLSIPTRLFEQKGHPCAPHARLLMRACHSCPFRQRHHANHPEASTNSVGLRPALRVGCHSATSAGCDSARLLFLSSARAR